MIVASFVAISIYINNSASMLNYTSIDTKVKNVKEPKDVDNHSWVQVLSKHELYNFSYPSSELFISLDFSDKRRTNTLKITNLDSYKFFCLNEVLKSNNIKFAYQRIADSVILEVILDNENLKHMLVGELNKYNISYSIQ